MKPIGESYAPLLQPYRHKAYYGGRGSAKSHHFAEILAIRSSMEPKRIVCARQFQNSIRDSVKELIELKIEENHMRGEFYITDREIEHKGTHSRFTFIGIDRNPHSAKSLEGADVCWVEEAQACNKKSLRILIPTIRKKGSEIWWSWNPSMPEDPVDDMFRGNTISDPEKKKLFNPPPNSVVREVSWRHNPYWTFTELQADMEYDKRRDYDTYKHVWEGGYETLSEATIFRNISYKIIDPPPEAGRLFGCDFGFANDPMALLGMWHWKRPSIEVDGIKISGGQVLYIDQENWGTGVVPNAMQTFFDKLDGIKSQFITCDSARPELIAHLNSYGYRAHPAKKGPNSVKDGLDFLKSYDIVIHPRCVNTAREFRNAKWPVDKKTDKILPEPPEHDNHSIDAARYATELLRNGIRVRAA